MREKFDAVKQELLENPGILAVGAGSNVPTYGYFFSNSLWSWDGKDPDEEVLMRATGADVDFLETLGMEIVAGRSFSKDYSTEEGNALIVNEAAVTALRMADPVGQRLSQPNSPGTIVGVVKNYHFRSLHQKIDPLILIYYPQGSSYVFARLKGENMPRTIAHIESIWNKFAPGFDFRYRFLDEALDDLYRAEQSTGTLFRYFSALAILISCLGLFGLASYLAEQRTKEIGIRKVLGATIANIVLLLSKDFTKWVVVANLVAWPVAYFVIHQWLQSYPYRIALPWWVFGAAGFSALAIASITVSYQSIKAAVANPVDSLRYE
jgi:putative ABC transport system permease protein